MPEQATVTFDDVESIDVQTRNGASKKYVLKTTDGKRLETWDRETAVEAAKSKGQLVKVSYNVEERASKDGRVFKNLKVVGLEPTGEQAPLAAGAGELIPSTTNNSNTATTNNSNTANGTSEESAYERRKNARIARQVAFKGAIELLTSAVFADEAPNIDGVNRLTEALLPVVEGTHAVAQNTEDTQESFDFGSPSGQDIDL